MSVRCHHCGLFNSFTFNTKQINCIKCNKILDREEVEASHIYRENTLNRTFNYQNIPWNDTENTLIISDKSSNRNV